MDPMPDHVSDPEHAPDVAPPPPASTAFAPLHAIVPLRTLAGGKARLGGALDAEEREELVLGMLRRTLAVLADWPPATRIIVVSPDAGLLAGLHRPGLTTILQDGEGLNEGLLLARHHASQHGARAVLILPADLPHLRATALDRLLEAADAALAAGGGGPLVVIAPSDARLGTNALFLSPPGVIEPAFGTASFEAHVRAAAKQGASVQVVTDAALGFDLDTPEDLELLSPAELSSLMQLGRPTS
jgi:2-phospho-L-lactate/phosphoenolpyruvate guanylyltransferase